MGKERADKKGQDVKLNGRNGLLTDKQSHINPLQTKRRLLYLTL